MAGMDGLRLDLDGFRVDLDGSRLNLDGFKVDGGRFIWAGIGIGSG